MAAAAIGFLLLGGCSNLMKRSDSQPSPRVVKSDLDVPMTPEEREGRFQRVCAEGMRLVAERRVGLALGAFEEAVSLKPNSITALFNLGACYEELGDPMRAVSVYRRVLSVSPDDPDCYRNLGTCYIKMYYREKSPVWRRMARNAWRRSLKLSADQPDVRAYLAKTETLD